MYYLNFIYVSQMLLKCLFHLIEAEKYYPVTFCVLNPDQCRYDRFCLLFFFTEHEVGLCTCVSPGVQSVPNKVYLSIFGLID